MKLFLTIFGAILAAAAVLFGIHSYSVAQDEAKAQRAEDIKSLHEWAEQTADLSSLSTMDASVDSSVNALILGGSHVVTINYILSRRRSFGYFQESDIASIIRDYETILVEAKRKKVPLEQITTNEAYLADLKKTFNNWKNKGHSL